jgi:hypothetical protein
MVENIRKVIEYAAPPGQGRTELHLQDGEPHDCLLCLASNLSHYSNGTKVLQCDILQVA